MTYRMWHKDYNEFVTVYQIRENNCALLYSPSLAKKSNCGWVVAKLSRLVPEEEYKSSNFDIHEDTLPSSFINNIANSVFSVNSQHDPEKEKGNG